MGSGASSQQVQLVTSSKRSIKAVVGIMMPVYYTEDNVTAADYQIGHASWDLILNNTSPIFLSLSPQETSKYGTCIMFFYETFYNRLFDVHPLCKPLFKSGLKAQGKALINIVTLALSMMDNQKQFDEVMVKLAETHNAKGIKAVEYGIVGETLLYTLEKCLGANVMNFPAKMAWTRIFCRMLRIIIPVAVAYEMANAQAQQLRFKEMLRSATEEAMTSHLSNNERDIANNSTPSQAEINSALLEEFEEIKKRSPAQSVASGNSKGRGSPNPSKGSEHSSGEVSISNSGADDKKKFF